MLVRSIPQEAAAVNDDEDTWNRLKEHILSPFPSFTLLESHWLLCRSWSTPAATSGPLHLLFWLPRMFYP